MRSLELIPVAVHPADEERQPIAQAAATTVYAATVADADEVGGRYLEDCHVAPIDDTPGFRDGVMSYALDPARAVRLWDMSESLLRAAASGSQRVG